MTLPAYHIPDAAIIDTLRQELGNHFTLTEAQETSHQLILLDTFDWRLFQNKTLLLKNGRSLELVALTTEQPLAQARISSRKQPRFAWDLPPSELAGQLAPVIEMRALLPVLQVRRQTTVMGLLNADQKTVARLLWESTRTDSDGPDLLHCRLLPVKGYREEAWQVEALMDAAGLPKDPPSALVQLIEASGQQPGRYTSKVVGVPMTAGTPAGDAARRLLAHLVGVMNTNIDGIQKDIDSEFLHDFRVSVRRARTLLGQVRQVFGEQTTVQLRSHLQSLGQITGPVRDLDVYLLKKNRYAAMVPEPLQPGIEMLFQSLAGRRRYALGKLRTAMRAPAFETTIQALSDFAKENALPSETEAPNAQRPIGELARTVIYKRYRKVVKKGRGIDDRAEDDQLHRLRIDCKKLRYLMEFFTPLFPDKEIKALIKQLKSLQDNLGDFNDLSVQQSFLYDFLLALPASAQQPMLLAAAVGALVTRLHLSQKQLRGEFMDVFARFDAKDNRRRFKQLFAPRKAS